jgi:hypothetical protein
MYRLSGFDPFRSSMRLTKKKAPCGVLSEATGRSGQKWPVMLDRPISANANWLGTGLRVNGEAFQKPLWASLLTFDGVLDPANRVRHLAFGLVEHAFALQLLASGHVACARLFARARDYCTTCRV